VTLANRKSETVIEEILQKAALGVVQSAKDRKFDQNRVFNESLFSMLFCGQLVALNPGLQARIWRDYRPWPQESDDSIGIWVEREEGPIAIEVHADDPQDQSTFESARVWDQIISDVLRMATAIQHCGLTAGYVLLVGELRLDPNDERVAHLPSSDPGTSSEVETESLQKAAIMDAGFFEELMHPGEATPHSVVIELVACRPSEKLGFWLWKVGLPGSEG
jgi:hypothetical protein